MHHPKAGGKLLAFPARTLPPESIEQWIDQILDTKDHLVSALEFLRSAYNEMLAGTPVREVDDILAQVEAILKSNEKVKAYTVVGVIKTRGARTPKAKRSLLPFPHRSKRSLDFGRVSAALRGAPSGDCRPEGSMPDASPPHIL